MLRIVVAVAVVVVAAGHARAEEVRWGVGYTGMPKELTGPQPTFKAYCKGCTVGERMAKPPKPYLAVQFTKPEPRVDSAHGYDVVLIAIRVNRVDHRARRHRGWPARDRGRHEDDK